MIAGESHSLTLTNQITARISNVGYDCAVKAKSADNQRSRHRAPRNSCSHPRLKYLCIGTLYQARKHGAQRIPANGFTESMQYALYSHAGCNFPALLTANSICQSEQPSSQTRFIGRLRKNATERILIVIPQQSGIGNLGKLHFQHGTWGANESIISKKGVLLSEAKNPDGVCSVFPASILWILHCGRSLRRATFAQNDSPLS